PVLFTNSATHNSKKSVSFEILNDDNFTAFPQSTIDSSQIIGSPPKRVASNIPISPSNEIYTDDCNSLIQETQLLPPQPTIDHIYHDHTINSSSKSNDSRDLKNRNSSSNKVYPTKTKNLDVNLNNFDSFSEQVDFNKMEIDLGGSIDVVNETQFTTSTNILAKNTDLYYLKANNDAPSTINKLEKNHLFKPRIPETQYIDFDTINDSQINFINDSNSSNFFQKSPPLNNSPKINSGSQSNFIDPDNKCESITKSSTSDLNVDDESLHISGTRISEIKTNSKYANNTPIHILSNPTSLFEKEHIIEDTCFLTQTPVDLKSKNNESSDRNTIEKIPLLNFDVNRITPKFYNTIPDKNSTLKSIRSSGNDIIIDKFKNSITKNKTKSSSKYKYIPMPKSKQKSRFSKKFGFSLEFDDDTDCANISRIISKNPNSDLKSIQSAFINNDIEQANPVTDPKYDQPSKNLPDEIDLSENSSRNDRLNSDFTNSFGFNFPESISNNPDPAKGKSISNKADLFAEINGSLTRVSTVLFQTPKSTLSNIRVSPSISNPVIDNDFCLDMTTPISINRSTQEHNTKTPKSNNLKTDNIKWIWYAVSGNNSNLVPILLVPEFISHTSPFKIDNKNSPLIVTSGKKKIRHNYKHGISITANDRDMDNKEKKENCRDWSNCGNYQASRF
ncbi:hypothetical protein AYI69_g6754, partial [Smittium culicis]